MIRIERLTIITMKKFTSLLIGCSLTLAGAAWAQQPEGQQSPAAQTQTSSEAQTGAAKGPNAEPQRQDFSGQKHRGQGKKAERRAAREQQRAQGQPKSEGAAAGSQSTTGTANQSATGAGA